MQRMIRDHDEQLYDDKLDNIDEMDKFLETWNLPRLNYEETEISTDQLLVRKLNQ